MVALPLLHEGHALRPLRAQRLQVGQAGDGAPGLGRARGVGQVAHQEHHAGAGQVFEQLAREVRWPTGILEAPDRPARGLGALPAVVEPGEGAAVQRVQVAVHVGHQVQDPVAAVAGQHPVQAGGEALPRVGIHQLARGVDLQLQFEVLADLLAVDQRVGRRAQQPLQQGGARPDSGRRDENRRQPAHRGDARAGDVRRSRGPSLHRRHACPTGPHLP